MWLNVLGMGFDRDSSLPAMEQELDHPTTFSMLTRFGTSGDAPADAGGWALLGWQAELAGNLEKAFHDYNLAAGIGAEDWVYARQMAVAVTLGQWAVAARACRRLCEQGTDDGSLRVVLGGLLSKAGHADEAAGQLITAIEQLANDDTPEAEQENMVHTDLNGSAPTSAAREICAVQTVVNRGLLLLQKGQFVRGGELFERALSLTETLMQAHAQWMMTEQQIHAELPAHLVESLITLGQTSDLLLQYVARAKLAENLAEVLKARHLRQDLAAWATGLQEVQALLKSELSHLSAMLPERANHAELHYRLGLLRRATGDLEGAAIALKRVLTLHPHHAASAVRLAMTLLQLHRPREAAAALQAAMEFDTASARGYHALTFAARQPARFDRAIEALATDMGDGFGRAEVKANLAFALGAMGVMDAKRGAWRNPSVPAGQS